MEKAYRLVGISVIGNDVDERWKSYYPEGNWITSDALSVQSDVDVTVFAPAFSSGCLGRREDALMVEEVMPSFYDFIKSLQFNKSPISILVCPVRAFSTRLDKIQLWRLINKIKSIGKDVEIIEQKC